MKTCTYYPDNTLKGVELLLINYNDKRKNLVIEISDEQKNFKFNKQIEFAEKIKDFICNLIIKNEEDKKNTLILTHSESYNATEQYLCQILYDNNLNYQHVD